MKMAAIRQFLEEVDWGDLDFLVVDLPPGTGDEALSIAQSAPNVSGAVIVTTPQDVATIDSRKAVKFVEMLGIRVLGIIENMSGMVCPHCGKGIDLFGKGGGEKAAEGIGVPFLGAIPMNPEMRKAGDEGRPFIIKRGEENPTWEAVDRVMEALVKEVECKSVDFRKIHAGKEEPLPIYKNISICLENIETSPISWRAYSRGNPRGSTRIPWTGSGSPSSGSRSTPTFTSTRGHGEHPEGPLCRPGPGER